MGIGTWQKCLCWYLLQNLRRRTGFGQVAPLESASLECPNAFEQLGVVPTSTVHKRKHPEMTLSTHVWRGYAELLSIHSRRSLGCPQLPGCHFQKYGLWPTSHLVASDRRIPQADRFAGMPAAPPAHMGSRRFTRLEKPLSSAAMRVGAASPTCKMLKKKTTKQRQYEVTRFSWPQFVLKRPLFFPPFIFDLSHHNKRISKFILAANE